MQSDYRIRAGEFLQLVELKACEDSNRRNGVEDWEGKEAAQPPCALGCPWLSSTVHVPLN